MENQAYSDSVNSISSGISQKEKMADLESAEKRCEGGRRKSSSTSISNNETKTKMTFFIAICSFVKDITIEPMLFVKNAADYSYKAVIENFKLDRFCNLQLNHTEEECSLMHATNHTDILVESQHLVNTFSIYEQMAQTILPLIIVLFAGSWSDKHGRKSLLLVSLISYSLYMIVCLLTAIFTDWPIQILLTGEFIKGAGGGDMMFLMIIYSYMTDRTSKEERFYRMALMNAIWFLGQPAGTILGAILCDAGGYIVVFSTSLAMYIFCFVYIQIAIKDKIQNPSSKSSMKEGCKGTFNLSDPINTIRFVITKRPDGGRGVLLGLIATMLIYIFTLPKVQFLWTQRMFNWSLDQYSIWQTIDSTYHQVLVLIASPIMVVLGLHDCTMGAIFAITECACDFWKGCITREDQWWVMYASTIVNLSPELVAVAIRSSISKVCQEDAGKAFSLLAMAEVPWMLLDKAMFAEIYDTTLETYPSAHSLVGAGFAAIAAMLLIGLRFSMIKFEKRRERLSTQ